MNSPIPLMTSQVREFMVTFDQPTYSDCEHTPPEIASFRASLIEEESREFHSAPPITQEELDAICDLLYVVIGTAITCSIALDPIIPYSPAVFTGKTSLIDRVIPCIQDLYCRFPCTKSQIKYLNAIVVTCLEIGLIVGYDVPGAFTAVHKNNMAKLWQPGDGNIPRDHITIRKPQGLLIKNKKGKVVKPPSHVPPDLSAYMPSK